MLLLFLQRQKALEAQGKEIINLGIGQPDFRTPKHIVDAAKKALDDGFSWLHPSKWSFRIKTRSISSY
jgi:aspartate aminotransferase